MEYGYVRESPQGKEFKRQLELLSELGISPDHIITDEDCGKNFNYHGLNMLVGASGAAPLLCSGDRLTIFSIDRLGRTYTDLSNQWRHITEDIGADIRILNVPTIDTSGRTTDQSAKAVTDVVSQLLEFFAEKERKNIHRKQVEAINSMARDKKGRKVSAKTGNYMGRQEIQKPKNFEKVVAKWKAGEITALKAMELTGLKRGTFYKLVKEVEE